jgi:hypothetical protein
VARPGKLTTPGAEFQLPPWLHFSSTSAPVKLLILAKPRQAGRNLNRADKTLSKADKALNKADKALNKAGTVLKKAAKTLI